MEKTKGKSGETVSVSKKSPVEFVHLHNHTHYSLLDGLQKIPEMLDWAESLGQKAIAITDHGTLSGAIEFYKECQARGIKPIIGMEAYVAPRKISDKSSKEDRTPYHLTLLAKNMTGYKNLMKLSTIASLEGFYYKPRIDRDLLQAHKDGLVVLTGCIGGELGTHILNENLAAAREAASWYKAVFGPEHYYLEMQPHIGWEPQDKVNAGLRQLAKELNLNLVVTGDAHYTRPEQRYAHDILICVQTGSTVEDPNRMKMEQDLSVYSGETIAERFPDEPEVLSNTVKIAQMCNLEIELGKILIPKFEVPQNETEKSYLRKLVFAGAAYRYLGIPKEDVGLMTEAKVKPKLKSEVLQRIEYELGVIAKMGYEGYFLIVADLINWAKNQGIVCGPGRGSAAGSMIAYLTNITALDPIKYDLLFERFLNPDRISMPDIDMDYADDRREEVIAYATQKYGEDRVAQIITFGIMAARNAVRDTGRVLGMSYGDVDAIAKLIPPPIQGRHVPLRKSIVDDPDLSKEYKTNPRAKNLIDVAMQLEGTIRNAGTHAAGVVITPEAITEYAPLTRASKGGISTQYSMGPIEDLGLLKFDFLGLSNLTIIKNTLRIIKRVYNVELDVADIPIDDPKAYGLMSRGETTGVFQLESAGMKRYIRELRPNKFEDIIAMVALYRPGPMQWIEDFITRKNNPELISYDHPKMKAALQNTHGIIVYQEQVMQLATDLCGFTGGQADTLRKGIGKKNPQVLAKMKKEFIDGAIKTSQADPVFADKLWKSLEDFAAYCFNKSHAACYALIAVQTAYLKAHYPSAFMAALMTSDYENLDRIAIEVAECRRLGIEVLPPSINQSYKEFSAVPETGHIRFGLPAVKNVGTGPVETILEARGDEPFVSLEDFLKRVDGSAVNRKVMESLIKVGALDDFGERAVLLENIDKILAYGSRAQAQALSGQIDIFGAIGTNEQMPTLALDVPKTLPDSREQLAWEKELMGLYISKHPLDDYRNYLEHKTEPLTGKTKSDDGKKITVGGIITGVRKITTKTGANMAFVALGTLSGDIELIVFPRVYERNVELWQADKIIEVTGKINARDREGRLIDEIKLMADSAREIRHNLARRYLAKPPRQATDFQQPEKDQVKSIGPLKISIPTLYDNSRLVKIKQALQAHSGSSEVFLTVGNDARKTIKLPFKVELNSDLIAMLESVVEKNALEFDRGETARKTG